MDTRTSPLSPENLRKLAHALGLAVDYFPLTEEQEAARDLATLHERCRQDIRLIRESERIEQLAKALEISPR